MRRYDYPSWGVVNPKTQDVQLFFRTAVARELAAWLGTYMAGLACASCGSVFKPDDLTAEVVELSGNHALIHAEGCYDPERDTLA